VNEAAAPSYRSFSRFRFRFLLPFSFLRDPLSSPEDEGTSSYLAGAGRGGASSSDEGLSGSGTGDEAAVGMFREEASKEKLGFESHWDSAVGSEVVAARGKRGNREDEFVRIFGLSP
jgi:hypothetical protein